MPTAAAAASTTSSLSSPASSSSSYSASFPFSSSSSSSFDSSSSPPPSVLIFSFGSSRFGQLGLGSLSSAFVPTPTPISSLPSLSSESVSDSGFGSGAGSISIVSLSARSNSAACVTSDGSVFAWGKLSGSGVGTPQRMEKIIGTDGKERKPIGVEVGEKEYAVWTDGGEVWVWNSTQNKPTRIQGELVGKKVIQVSIGRSHLLALTDSGQVFGVGSNKKGSLGLGQTIDEVDTPTRIPIENPISKISAGNYFSLFLEKSGSVWVTGDNSYGTAGIGSLAPLYLNSPTPIPFFSSSSSSRPSLLDISAGEFHALGVSTTGEVFAWGLGSDGQIGVGGKNVHNPAPVKVGGLKELGVKTTKVIAGGGHSAVIGVQGRKEEKDENQQQNELEEHDQLFVWGRGREGQLGRGDQRESVAATRETPVKVEFFNRYNRYNVKKVACGSDFTIVAVQPNTKPND